MIEDYKCYYGKIPSYEYLSKKTNIFVENIELLLNTNYECEKCSFIDDYISDKVILDYVYELVYEYDILSPQEKNIFELKYVKMKSTSEMIKILNVTRQWLFLALNSISNKLLRYIKANKNIFIKTHNKKMILK